MQRAEQLAAFLAGQRSVAFDWGRANCAHHFAAPWVRLMCGWDPLAAVPAPTSARAAMRLVRAHGGDLAAACARLLGVPTMPASLAQLGDIVMLEQGADCGGAALGICAGRNAVFRTVNGLASLPLRQAACAWRLPC